MAVFTIYQNAQSCRNSNQADFTHLALLNIFLKEKFRVITFPGSNFGDTTTCFLYQLERVRDGTVRAHLTTSTLIFILPTELIYILIAHNFLGIL